MIVLHFAGSLASDKAVVWAIKCVFINNHQCKVRPTHINLNLNELYYYLFIISMNRYDESCNTIDNPFGRILVANEMEVINPKVGNTQKKDK